MVVVIGRTGVWLESSCCAGCPLARMIHEQVCSSRRSAVATSLRLAGSSLGPSRFRSLVSRRDLAILRRTV